MGHIVRSIEMDRYGPIPVLEMPTMDDLYTCSPEQLRRLADKLQECIRSRGFYISLEEPITPDVVMFAMQVLVLIHPLILHASQ